MRIVALCGNGYCYFSQEINHFSKPFQVINIQNASFSKLNSHVLKHEHFFPVSRRKNLVSSLKVKIVNILLRGTVLTKLL